MELHKAFMFLGDSLGGVMLAFTLVVGIALILMSAVSLVRHRHA